MKKNIKKTTKGPKGLGGWLILPIIGMFLSILIISFEILSYTDDLLVVILDLAIILLTAYTLYLIFNKKKKAKTWTIITFVIYLALNVMNYQFPYVIGNFIWIVYFLVSKRVKNTFVN